MPRSPIRVDKARQNNLKGISVTVEVGEVTVVTGVAGAGKSSLAFEVLYAEGYRRYVETFSPYARQFLERIDRPEAEDIQGVLPGVAIARAAPVQTSRSTVGTMTNVDDYLRQLYARVSVPRCDRCGRDVQRDTPASVFRELEDTARGKGALVCFSRETGGVGRDDLAATLTQAGFSRVLENGEPVRIERASLDPEEPGVTVVLDRIHIDPERRGRIVGSLESAFHFGKGSMEVRVEGEGSPRGYSSRLHCARCDIEYRDPTPGLFSFNHPEGACSVCNGFGRIMDIDPDLVVPDASLSVAEGAVKPFQTPAFEECQDDLVRFLRRRSVSPNIPWRELDDETRRLVWEGDGRSWYGLRGFFDYLSSKRYRRHVRILLSRYRRYLECAECGGTRLKPEVRRYRIEGRSFPEVQAMSVDQAGEFFREAPRGERDRAASLLLEEIRGRLRFLSEVGLGYVSLGRQSRTLSGGETQRTSLATALGSSLTNTLYVLDEPSAGLHPRDEKRLARVLGKLAAAGNAVVVVEHGGVFIRSAHRVIDLGPGPGGEGGRIVYAGPVAGLEAQAGSPTGAYLRGELRAEPPEGRRTPGTRVLRIEGASENNLRGITLDIPLGMLVGVTGVSGSGKSTLVEQVLYRNLLRNMGQQAMEPGRCISVRGTELIGAVVLVDQSPMSRNPRMNAASALGVLDPLRAVFARTRKARDLGLGRSAFSFNSRAGACPHCGGAGFERVELQFLPDVYVRCPACDGKRFRPEVLEVRHRGLTIAEALELPAAEAANVFGEEPRVVEAIRPLLDIGLGYLSLGQSAPTLSGGEAQRLKLARHLARARGSKNLLFVLDEPTAGLHPANTRDLIDVLRRLVEDGHSVLATTHDMDVAGACDWIIDLGPEGGEEGGLVVGTGSPEQVAAAATPTGRALHEALAQTRSTGPVPVAESFAEYASKGEQGIRIRGARENNLKEVDVTVPEGRITAITGISGSGKSSLAFDVLYTEGRRRFLDCLPAYARQYTRPLPRPDVDSIENIPPTVALEQKVSRSGAMSTAGTTSEAYHYLRLLFAALGEPHCPSCGRAGEGAEPSAIAARIETAFPGSEVTILAPLVRKRKGEHRELIRRTARQGVERVRVDGAYHRVAAPPDLDRNRVHDVEAVVPAPDLPGSGLLARVERGLELGRGAIVAVASESGAERAYSAHRSCPQCGAGLPVADPRLFTWSQKFGACPRCEGTGTMEKRGELRRCPECGGSRLRPEARAVLIGSRSIADVAAMPAREVLEWARGLQSGHGEVSARVLPELAGRLAQIDRLGAGYLTLDRATNTLSTGEAQRIRLAAELASNLQGVCYVLDEPTVGLHPRDTEAMIEALADLRDRGNSVVVVEHEDRLIRETDHVIDMGPGSGRNGGRVTARGTVREIADCAESVTGRWLREESVRELSEKRPLGECERLRITGARLHNLQGVDAEIPLARFVCVTGVSGSGKSTLVREVLRSGLEARLRGRGLPPVLEDLQGWEGVSRVREVDESPIGRTPRSVPATYVGIMDPVRRLFARTPEARARGFTPGRFSFNVSGGRCESCKGHGRHKVEMPLLPVVYLECETCGGRRYNPETLEARFKGHSIADVLEMSVDEARDLFANFPAVSGALGLLSAIGLGYLQLGQPSPTLSGGEAQRIKLAAEMARPSAKRSLFILDEPTTGLHMADVSRLLDVLQQLVQRGDSVVAIEHDLDVAAAADCVIDMGPEGGAGGGRIVAAGSPREVAGSGSSWTGRYLRAYLERRDGPN